MLIFVLLIYTISTCYVNLNMVNKAFISSMSRTISSDEEPETLKIKINVESNNWQRKYTASVN